MSEGMRRDEASAGLAAIRATQEALIRRVAVPPWYWAVVALLTVLLGVVVDLGQAVAVAVAAVLFAVVVAGATGWVILGGGRVQVGRDLLGEAGAIRIVGFVAIVVGASLAIGFALQALGWRYPATVATLVAGIGIAAGGPLLMRSLQASMRRRGAAG